MAINGDETETASKTTEMKIWMTTDGRARRREAQGEEKKR